MPDLILASRSPQRRAILEQLGIAFSVVASDAEELMEGPPEEVALENAYRKARRVADAHPGSLVLGVDTVVVLGRQIYGKPADRGQAGEILQTLRGRRHVVVSGICLIENRRERSAAARSAVAFRAFDEATLEWYLDTGEWRERAGGYAIQGRGAALVAGIEGDYLNVVGLPVTTLLDLEPGLVGPDAGDAEPQPDPEN